MLTVQVAAFVVLRPKPGQEIRVEKIEKIAEDRCSLPLTLSQQETSN